jgi:hypothetical protein
MGYRRVLKFGIAPNSQKYLDSNIKKYRPPKTQTAQKYLPMPMVPSVAMRRRTPIGVSKFLSIFSFLSPTVPIPPEGVVIGFTNILWFLSCGSFILFCFVENLKKSA